MSKRKKRSFELRVNPWELFLKWVSSEDSKETSSVSREHSQDLEDSNQKLIAAQTSFEVDSPLVKQKKNLG
jgi:hypothetical protein